MHSGTRVTLPAMAVLTIDESFVERWSQRYADRATAAGAALERQLFNDVGPAARARMHLEMDELLQIGRWKAARSASHLSRNDPMNVRHVTRAAFAPKAVERLSILTTLYGVQDAMASSILTVWSPEQYTVWDVRAIWTMQQAGLIEDRAPFGWYLISCRALADSLAVSATDVSKLRTLDRALWQYSKENQPPVVRGTR